MNGRVNDVILYGAGNQGKYAVDIVKNYGLNPVAFCDADEKKAGTIYCGLPVFTKEETRKQFGENLKLWVTPEPPLRDEIVEGLVAEKFAQKKDICNLSLKPTLGCFHLQSTVIVNESRLYQCCVWGDLRNYPPYTEVDNEDWESTITRYLENRNEIMAALAEGRPCACDGCPSLYEGYWGNGGGGSSKIHVLAISPSYPCQLSCKYCAVPGNAREIEKNREAVCQAKKLDIAQMMRVLEEKDVLDLKEPIQLSAGEITILSNKKEILDSLSKYPVQVFSNCVLYDAQISEMISRKDGSFLNVSVDAGTRETYREVKGLDAYDRVLSHIRRYAQEGAVIEIKYILMPENCDRENIDGFLAFCKEISPRALMISGDLNVDHTNLPAKIIDGVIYMARQAERYGIPYRIMPYFGDKNMERIQEELNVTGEIK